MDGGGLVIEQDGKAISAWRREKDIFLAEGAAERRVGPGKDVALVRNGQGTYLAWTHEGGIEALTPRSAKPVVLAKEGGFAALLVMKDGSVLAAWETAATIEFDGHAGQRGEFGWLVQHAIAGE